MTISQRIKNISYCTYINMDYVSEYKTKGFFVIQNVFKENEINEILSGLNEVESKDITETITKDKDSNILRLENILYNNKNLKSKIEKEQVQNILKNCMETDINLFKDKIIYKNPGSENSLVPHVDGLFKSYNYRLKKETFGWYTYSSKFINLTIMLTDNTIENGCLYINKIKNNDINYIYNNFIINNQNNKINMNNVNDGFYPITGKKGSILVFNPLCIHYSKNNYSNLTRKNIYLTYSNKNDGDNYLLNLNDKILAIKNKGKNNVEKLSSGNDYFNILIIGFGNIGFRYLQALQELKYYSINLTIVSTKDPNLENIKYNFYKNVKEIDSTKLNHFDIVIISTCSDVRYRIINELLDNDNIKNINYLILEKITFSNINEYNEFNKLDKKKINNIFINSFWKYDLNIDELSIFRNPMINIKSNNKFGICCNLIHILIYLDELVKIENINIEKYEIIQSKRNNYNELIFKLNSDFLNIEQSDNLLKPFLNITLEENENKLEFKLKENNEYLITFYKNNLLVSTYEKKITNVSTHLINQFNSMLIDNINEIKLCDNNVSYESHKKLFNLFKDIENLKIT